MFEIRFHGRGGQGAVTAAEIFALAVFLEGKEPQSFPEFGVERRGAPVKAFCRIDDKKIIIHSNVYRPDCVVVFDISLIKTIDVLNGVKEGGCIILNSNQSPEKFSHLKCKNIATIDATGIALNEKLGSEAAPIVNTTILGALAKITGLVRLENLLAAIKGKVGQKIENNLRACEKAYNTVKIFKKEDEKNV